jgi:hypothetical protein
VPDASERVKFKIPLQLELQGDFFLKKIQIPFWLLARLLAYIKHVSFG